MTISAQSIPDQQMAQGPGTRNGQRPAPRYQAEIEAEIDAITGTVADSVAGSVTGAAPGVDVAEEQRVTPRWMAIQLLEGAMEPADCARFSCSGYCGVNCPKVENALAAGRTRLNASPGRQAEVALAGQRYDYAQQIAAQVVTRRGAAASFTDRVDRVAAHPWLGLPFFLLVMYLLFSLVQNVASPLVDWVDRFFSVYVAHLATAGLDALAAPAWVTSLLVDGVIAGVGGVLTFFPSLLIMYLLLALLEESGYLARAAFVMDRFMGALGLHGKAFVPLILGFGCNVPAIYATRTMEERPARILTGLLVPFMSCSARLPIYVIFGLAFFPRHAGPLIWSLYLLGVVVAAAVGILLSRTLFRNAPRSSLIMEMPDYRAPSLHSLLRTALRRTADFARKAGTVILLVSVILWVLMHFPADASPRESYFGQLSSGVAPILAPAGFGEWEAAGALLTGLAAKEAVVSTLAQVHALPSESDDPAAAEPAPCTGAAGCTLAAGRDLGHALADAGRALLTTFAPWLQNTTPLEAPVDSGLRGALQDHFTALSALAFMIFAALYVPCVATIAALRQEFGRRWAVVALVLTLAVPWSLSVLVYQVGRFFLAT